MPAERFYFPHSLTPNTPITLQGDECHHMIKVMRNGVKDRVEIMNGQNELAIGEITAISKNSAEIHLLEVVRSIPTSFCILVQGLVKMSKLEWIVEKAVEVNVKEIRLFPALHSEKVDMKDSQLTRLNSIVLSAVKQCGRLDIPPVTLIPGMEKWSNPTSPAYFGSLNEDAPAFFSEQQILKPSSECLFVIGPEKGLHEKEMSKLKNLEYKGVSLSHNILRTETAAITACAIADHLRKL